MLEATQKKLREALFFLAHIERVAFSGTNEPREAAAFYVSAFLSAARSVTFALESEEPETYPDWSVRWRSTLTDGERKLLAAFTAARNRALKRETPEVQEDYIASALRDPFAGFPAELRFFFQEELPDVADRVFKGRLFPERTEEELLPLCRQYIQLLSTLVAAFLETRE